MGFDGLAGEGKVQVQWWRRRATAMQMDLHKRAVKGLCAPGSPRSALLLMGRGCRECQVKCRSFCFPFHPREEEEESMVVFIFLCYQGE